MTIKVSFLTGSYSANDLVTQFGAIRKDGILSGGAVTENSPNNLSVDVASVKGIKNGYFMNSDQNVNVPITSNTSGYSRIDSICLDMDNQAIIAVAGTPSSSPTAPVLTGNKLLLANVTVGNNVSTIVQANISDLRSDVPAITDANNLGLYNDTGFYICDGSAANIPSGATNGGTLIHMARKNRATQLFFDYMNTILYIRSYTGSWTNWDTIGSSMERDTWHTPTFQNGWVNFGGSNAAGYMKDNEGYVHLRGLIKSGTMAATAFNLPAGYRPPQSIQCSTVSVDLFGEILITSAGNVAPQAGSSTWISLDSVPPFKATA